MVKGTPFCSLDEKHFEKDCIYNVNNISVFKNNVIVGENGAGKTRFLKSLQNFRLSTRDDAIIITLFFPNNNPIEPNKKVNSNNGEFIYDILKNGDDIESTCVDFLHYIDNAEDKYTFIEDFFTNINIRAYKTQENAKKSLDKINKTFRKLLDREFIKKGNNINVVKYSRQDEVRTCTLDTAFIEPEMSPGESVLVYFMILLYYISYASNKKMIVIIDEPENHIHPQKLIQLITSLIDFDKISELWIATHSFYVLPLFEFENIILIDNNKICKRSSELYKKAFYSLIGQENENIIEFISSLDYWEYYQFITECFCCPETINNSNIKDEQFVKLLTSLNKLSNMNPLEILDYGAGKCRLWNCFKEFYKDQPKEMGKALKYTAYDPDPPLDFFPDEKILYIRAEELLENFKNKYDVVILMNVLHEISILDWTKIFRNIYNLLNNNGILIMVEATSLTRGEQPYCNNGFLVLGDNQVEILFNNFYKGEFINGDKSGMWIIEKKDINNINIQKIRECIKSLLNDTENDLKDAFNSKVNDIKKSVKEINQLSARKYAFLSQQYINAKFALDLITKDKKSIEYGEKKNSKKVVAPPPIKY